LKFPSNNHNATSRKIPVLIKNLDKGNEIAIRINAKKYNELYEKQLLLIPQ
jgi:hypothetical protein